MSRCGQSCQRTHSIGTTPLLMLAVMQIAYCSAIVSVSPEVRHVGNSRASSKKEGGNTLALESILYISDQATSSNSVLAALEATGCEVVGTDTATQAVALLFIMHAVLSSCSITGREDGPVLSWCEAYGRFGQVFRSSCCAVNRSATCHREWMPAEFTFTM